MKKILIPIVLLVLGLLLAFAPQAHATPVPLTISVSGPQLVFPNEQARWLIAISDNTGLPLNAATVVVGIIKPDNSLAGNSTISGNTVSGVSGVWWFNFTVPSIGSGVYGFVVHAYVDSTFSGFAVSSFQVSATLEGYNATLTNISNGVATIQTNVGEIKENISALNPKIDSINGNVVTLSTSMGNVTGTVNDLKIVVLGMSGKSVALNSTVGSFTGTLQQILGNTEYIQTRWGTLTLDQAVQTGVGESNQGNYLGFATLGAAVIAVMLGIVNLLRKPKQLRIVGGAGIGNGIPQSISTPIFQPTTPLIPREEATRREGPILSTAQMNPSMPMIEDKKKQPTDDSLAAIETAVQQIAQHDTEVEKQRREEDAGREAERTKVETLVGNVVERNQTVIRKLTGVVGKLKSGGKSEKDRDFEEMQRLQQRIGKKGTTQ